MKLLTVLLLTMFFLHSHETAAAAQPCQFVVTADQAPLYNAPLPHVSQQIAVLPQNGVYPILKQLSSIDYIDSPLLLEVSEDLQGWVSLGRGKREGECSRIEIDPTPPTQYPTVCTFTTDAVDPTSVWSEEVTFAVIGFEDGIYDLWIDHAKSLSVSADEGTLGGACTLPPTAVVLDNARLWSAPDVTNASLIALLASETPVTLLAGPVNGRIRLDSDTTGNWYRVSDSSGVIGWVWEQRLRFD